MRHVHSVPPRWWGSEWAVGCSVMIEAFYKSALERKFLTLKDIMLNERSQSQSPHIIWSHLCGS